MDSTQSPPAPVPPPPPAGTPEPLPYAVPALARVIPRPRPVIDGMLALMWLLACVGTILPALHGRSLMDELVRSITRVNRFDAGQALVTGFIAAAFLCWAVFLLKALRVVVQHGSPNIARRVAAWTLAGAGVVPVLAISLLFGNAGTQNETVLILIVLGEVVVGVLAILRLRKRVDSERLAVLAVAVPAIAPVSLLSMVALITGQGGIGLVFLAFGPAAWCAEVIPADQGSFRLDH